MSVGFCMLFCAGCFAVPFQDLRVRSLTVFGLSVPRVVSCANFGLPSLVGHGFSTSGGHHGFLSFVVLTSVLFEFAVLVLVQEAHKDKGPSQVTTVIFYDILQPVSRH